MTDKSIVQQAIDDINENLWLLHDIARRRVTGWFMAISQDSFQRGVEHGKKIRGDTLSRGEQVFVLEGLKLLKYEMKHGEWNEHDQVKIDKIIDLEQDLANKLSGVPNV